MKINMISAIGSGTLAGVIIMLVGAGLVPIIGDQMDKALENLSVPPLTVGAMVFFALTSLIFGVAGMVFYALIQHKFKSKLKAVLTVSIAFWFFTYFLSNASLVAYGFLPLKLVAIGTVWGLLELFIAIMVGSFFYKPKRTS